MIPEQRVLVLAVGRDATLTRQLLQEGRVEADLCPTMETLLEELDRGAAVAIVAQEVLTLGVVNRIKQWVDGQPTWSDFPFIVVAGGPDQVPRVAQAYAPLGNVSVLQRPIALDTFITSVQTALRARRRQYQIRDLLQEQAAADRRKDEFLAMLAHELRNPLAPIRSATEVMKLWHLPDQEQHDLIDLVRRQVTHMARLLDDLLDVSRITRGKVSLDRQRIDLAEVAEMAVRTVSPLMQQKQHTFEMRPSPKRLFVFADPTRIQQVISNLLHNAAKYTRPGGKITLELKRDGDQAVIAICDNGVGIAPEVLPQIFDLFTQEDRSLDRASGGLGIGLTIVKNLVQLHGGSVEAHSDGVDCGTEIVVRLPALVGKGPDPAPPARVSNEGAGSGDSKRILIVDDNADGGEMLARLLRAWGHTVEVAYDGPSGLALAGTYRPEICLLDIGLPGIDGYELARRIRREPWSSEIRLIAISGYGQEGDRERSRDAGFHSHLVKPVDPAALRKELMVVVAPESHRPVELIDG